MDPAHTLRVFTDGHGNYGDLATVVVDEGRHLSPDRRQTITCDLHTGETAFINDVSAANISIMHYQGEIDFAGTVTLAASWLLSQLQGNEISAMHGRTGDISTWQDDGLTWAQAELSTMPPWQCQQVDNPELIEHLTPEGMKMTEHTIMWAWLDEAKGLIRARTFASDWEIPEAEGNGSGAMVLAVQLNRSIEIKHGKGSVIFAKPAQSGYAAIGGRVAKGKDR